ncbi:MAG: endolytic transglycosylase MltG [Patescibacteria group bacterium]
MDTLQSSEIKKRSFFRSHKFVYLIFFIFFICIALYYLVSAPTPSLSFVNKQGVAIHISPNQALQEVALDLEEKKGVKYAPVLKGLVTFLGASHSVPKGDYVFKESVSAWRVAWMLARGIHNVDPVKVTFKEGITNEEMATILASKLTAFRRDLFLSDEKSRQGYLFPDTYFFFPMTTSEEIVDEMSANFSSRISKLKGDIEKSNHTESEIINMASILEKEAKGKDDAPVISGILWKRLKLGMPLQVDAERWTYGNTGLPPTPIANPGLVTIKASLAPVDSAYLYYLHGKDGMIHFAKTYEEHKSNINKYLR